MRKVLSALAVFLVACGDAGTDASNGDGTGAAGTILTLRAQPVPEDTRVRVDGNRGIVEMLY